MTPPPLTITHRPDGWWIVGLPDSDAVHPAPPGGSPSDLGPYDTKAEALDGRAGIRRTFRIEDQPGMWSVDAVEYIRTHPDPCRQTETQTTLF